MSSSQISIFKKYSSLKLAIGFVILASAVYFGYGAYGRWQVGGKNFPEIAPGKFALLGVTTSAGYKIIIANGIAQLVQGSSKFEEDMGDTGGDEGGDKHHIPIKDMVLSLQGDANALSNLVTAMNEDLRRMQPDIPANPVTWEAADLEKALQGDAKLKGKLEFDLNCHLDGTPLDLINQRALYTGIVIRLPVPVQVSVAGVPKTLTGHVLIPYRVGFTRKVERDLANKGLNPSDEETKGYYRQALDDLKAHPANRENVMNSIKVRISPSVVEQYAGPAEEVLKNTEVVLNESFIQNASVVQNGFKNRHPIYDLTLNLTEEGRERLWKYSLDKVHTQLLMIVNNVAIAAPRIRHQLSQSNITVTQLTDLSLAQDAVDTLNAASNKK